MSVMNVRHYKGGVYRYISVLIPLGKVSKDIQEDIKEFGITLYCKDADLSNGSTLEDILVYEYKGKKYVNKYDIHVLYYAYDTKLYWVRNATDFFGTVTIKGEVKKRFDYEYNTKV